MDLLGLPLEPERPVDEVRLQRVRLLTAPRLEQHEFVEPLPPVDLSPALPELRRQNVLAELLRSLVVGVAHEDAEVAPRSEG